jgi:hypothetical protein
MGNIVLNAMVKFETNFHNKRILEGNVSFALLLISFVIYQIMDWMITNSKLIK